MTRLALLALLAVGACACTSPDVLADVDGRTVRLSDVAEHQRTRAARTQAQALDALVEEELLAHRAIEAGLEKTPEIQARLRAAQRAILSQAALDAELGVVTEAAAQAAFDAEPGKWATRQVQLAHVFIAFPANADVEALRAAQSRANSAWARLLGGDEFGAVAAELSEDSATAKRGGDLGVVREGEIGKELFEAAAALREGEYTRPLQGPSGLHIFRATRAVQQVTPSFDAVKGRVVARLRLEAQAQLAERLKRTVAVKRYPEHLASAGDGGTR